MFTGHQRFFRVLGTIGMVMVMLLFVFCVISIMQTAVAAAPDYAVELNITTASPKGVNPSQTVQFSYQVKNVGAKDGVYWINTSCVPGDIWYQKGWMATVTLNKTTLLTNQSTASGVLSVTAPSNASYPDVASVTLCVESSNSSASASDVALVEVLPVYGVAIEDIVTSTIEPGDSGKYYFNVTNTGNCNETFTPTFLSWPAGWSIPLLDYTKVTLAPQGKMPVEMTVNVPADALVDDYHIQIKAYCDSASPYVNRAIDVYVEEVPGIDILVWSDTLQEADPGEMVLFTYEITNTGNYEEDFEVDYEYDTTCFNVYSSLNNMTLQPDESEFVDMWVQVSSGALPDIKEISINISTTTIDFYGTESVFLDVQQLYKVELFAEVLEKETAPQPSGGYHYLDFNITLKNSGSGQDPGIKLEVVEGTYSEWVSLDKEYISLEADETENFTATVRIPADQYPGDYDLDIKATSLANVAKYEDSNVTDIITITADVIQHFDFDVQVFSPLSTHLDLALGDSGEFYLSILNNGNDVDTFTIEVLGDTLNWASLSTTTKSVNSGIERTFFLTIDIPADTSVAMAGDYTLSVEVTSEDKVTKKSVDVSFTVEKYVSFSMLSVDDVTSASLALGEEFTYNLKIKNTGNCVDTLKLNKTGEKTEWLSFIGNTSYTLNPGETAGVKVNVRVPAQDEVTDMGDVYYGYYYHNIEVMSTGNDTLAAELELITNVEQYYSCELEEESDDGLVFDINSDSDNEYRFKVTNTGNKQDTISIDTDAPVGVSVDISRSTTTLSWGSTKTITATITFQNGFQGDTLSFKIIATPGNGYQTSGQQIITVTHIPVKKPDLTIVSITHDDEDGLARNGERITLKILIANNGTGELTSSSIGVEIDINGKSYTRTINGNLDPGETYELEYVWEFRRTEKTDFDIHVDPRNIIIESDDMNNKKTLTLESYESEYDGGTPEASSTFIYVIFAILFGLAAGVIVTAMFFNARAPKKPEVGQEDGDDDDEEDDLYDDDHTFGQDLPQDDIYNTALSPGSVGEDLKKGPEDTGTEQTEKKQKFKQIDE